MSGYAPDVHAEMPSIKLFLCGDVMTGRGIDQILSHPGKPNLYEPYIHDARDYIRIAERESGSIPRSVTGDYIWGEALAELDQRRPDVRLINLETSVTTSSDHWPDKGIHYRMHPVNVGCLTAANIDGCVLANNHVLDWGYRGLSQTLETLKQAHIQYAGAGESRQEAMAPAVFGLGEQGRVLVFSFGSPTSGVPEEWRAEPNRAGINFLEDLSDTTLKRISAQIKAAKQPGDRVVFSVHWGSNWGYEVSQAQRDFARALIDQAGVDLVHGHSSHHVKGFEIYQGKPIFYGCGDLINDYEGIHSYAHYRGELSLLYFVSFSPRNGRLLGMELVPMRMKRFQLHRAGKEESEWLYKMLLRESNGAALTLQKDRTLTVQAS